MGRDYANHLEREIRAESNSKVRQALKKEVNKWRMNWLLLTQKAANMRGGETVNRA